MPVVLFVKSSQLLVRIVAGLYGGLYKTCNFIIYESLPRILKIAATNF